MQLLYLPIHILYLSNTVYKAEYIAKRRQVIAVLAKANNNLQANFCLICINSLKFPFPGILQAKRRKCISSGKCHCSPKLARYYPSKSFKLGCPVAVTNGMKIILLDSTENRIFSIVYSCVHVFMDMLHRVFYVIGRQ